MFIAAIAAIEPGLGTFRGAARIYPTPDDLANGSGCACSTKTRKPTRSLGPGHQSHQ
jgi:hypothetical protein